MHELYGEEDDLHAWIAREHRKSRVSCVFVDEAQFLTEAQVWQLARVADRLDIPVLCYGLRTDFRGKLFAGSAELLAVADIASRDPHHLPLRPQGDDGRPPHR